MLFEPLFGLGQELSPALLAWDPYQGELSAAVRATYVLETQEVKGVRLITGLRSVRLNKSSETHPPRLFFCQFQSEPRIDPRGPFGTAPHRVRIGRSSANLVRSASP